jgi:hypothetical protein
MGKKLKDELRRYTFSVSLDGVGVDCDATIYGRVGQAEKGVEQLRKEYEAQFPDRQVVVNHHRHEVLTSSVVTQVRGLEAENKILSEALRLAIKSKTMGEDEYTDEFVNKQLGEFMFQARKNLFPQYFGDNKASVVQEAMEIEESLMENPVEESS